MNQRQRQMVSSLLISLLALCTSQGALAKDAKTSAIQLNQAPAKAVASKRQLLNQPVMAPLSQRQQRSMKQYLGSVNAKIEQSLSRADRNKINSLRKESERALKIKDKKLQQAALAKIQKKYAPLQSAILKKARVSNGQVVQRLNQIAPQRQFRLTGNTAKLIQSVLRKPPTQSTAATGNTRSYQAYPAVLQQSSCGGIFNFPRLDQAGFDAEIDSVASGCHANSGRGVIVSVPEGVNEVRIDIQLEHGFELAAIAAGFLGYAQANTDLGIHIEGPGVRLFELDNSIFAISPIIPMRSDRDVQGLYSMRTVFQPDPDGGDYRVMLYSGHFTLGAGISAATSRSSVPEISSIRATLR